MTTAFTNQVDVLKTYEQTFCLAIPMWSQFNSPCTLQWQSVSFANSSKALLPNERGVYAFVVEPAIKNTPSHGYVMYIGQTGNDNQRTLKQRFGDYIQNTKNIRNRHAVHYFLNKWETHLRFYYAAVSNVAISLIDIERSLNDALLPPFSKGDFSAQIKPLIKALR